MRGQSSPDGEERWHLSSCKGTRLDGRRTPTGKDADVSCATLVKGKWAGMCAVISLCSVEYKVISCERGLWDCVGEKDNHEVTGSLPDYQ